MKVPGVLRETEKNKRGIPEVDPFDSVFPTGALRNIVTGERPSSIDTKKTTAVGPIILELCQGVSCVPLETLQSTAVSYTPSFVCHNSFI